MGFISFQDDTLERIEEGLRNSGPEGFAWALGMKPRSSYRGAPRPARLKIAVAKKVEQIADLSAMTDAERRKFRRELRKAYYKAVAKAAKVRARKRRKHRRLFRHP